MNLSGGINTFHSDFKKNKTLFLLLQVWAICSISKLISLLREDSFQNFNNRFSSISVAKNMSFISALLYEGRRVNFFIPGAAWVSLYLWILWKAKLCWWFLIIYNNFITFELWHSVWLVKTKSPLLTSCLNFLRSRTFYSITIMQLPTSDKKTEV